jgi:hypothetical protein
MQNEAAFIVLDTVMMTICTGCQTFIHPGIFFSAMAENLSSPAPGNKEMFDLASTAPATPPEYEAPAPSGNYKGRRGAERA